MYRITAYSRTLDRRVHVFTWTRDKDSGIAHARRQAREHGLDHDFMYYRAEYTGKVVDITPAMVGE